MWYLHAGGRDGEHVPDPTVAPESPVDRSPEVEALAVQWMALPKAGDAAAASRLVGADEATLLVGTGPADWYPGGQATIGHIREALTASGGLPFEPAAPVGWADGDVGWFADQVRLAFPDKMIPLRMTGVAVRQRGQWRLVQVHLSASVTDEALLTATTKALTTSSRT